MASKKAKRDALAARLAQLDRLDDLGAWGAGHAERVDDTQAHRPCIRVRIDATAVPNSKTRRAFKRLLDHTLPLAHPAILPLLEGGTDDGHGAPYLLYADHPGVPLASLSPEDRPSPTGCLQIARDLLNALAHAHHHGVVHGALSAACVLVHRDDDGWHATLADLGFARIAGATTETPFGELRGAPETAAPETIKQEPVDARADVYSAAVLIHELLAGAPPISIKGQKDPLLHRLNENPTPLPPSTLPDDAHDEAVREALLRALNKNPEARYAKAHDLLRALTPGHPPLDPAAPTLPDGGRCVACNRKIPPPEERSWSRKDSDRPFPCSACSDVFCGAVHWDPLTLTCKRCKDQSLPTPSQPAPHDLELSSPMPTSDDASADQPEGADSNEPAKENEPVKEKVADAMMSAWASEKQRTEAARERVRQTRQHNRPDKQDTPSAKPSAAPAPLSEAHEPPLAWAAFTAAILAVFVLAWAYRGAVQEVRAVRVDAQDVQDDLHAEAKSRETQLAKLEQRRDELQQRVKTLSSSHGDASDEVETLRQQLTRVRTRLSEHEAEVVALRDQLAAADAEHTDSLASMATTCSAILAEVERRHQLAVQELSAAHETARQALQAEHQRAIAELRGRQLQALDALRAQLAQEHAEALASAQQRAQQERDELERRHQLTQQEANAQHAAALDAQRQELAAAHTQQLATLQTDHQEALTRVREALAAEHQAALAALRQQAQAQLEDAQREAAQRLRAAQVEHQEALERARGVLEDAQAQAVAQAVAGARATHEEQVAALRAEHAAELERLRAQLERAQPSSVSCPLTLYQLTAERALEEVEERAEVNRDQAQGAVGVVRLAQVREWLEQIRDGAGLGEIRLETSAPRPDALSVHVRGVVGLEDPVPEAVVHPLTLAGGTEQDGRYWITPEVARALLDAPPLDVSIGVVVELTDKADPLHVESLELVLRPLAE